MLLLGLLLYFGFWCGCMCVVVVVVGYLGVVSDGLGFFVLNGFSCLVGFLDFGDWYEVFFGCGVLLCVVLVPYKYS